MNNDRKLVEWMSCSWRKIQQSKTDSFYCTLYQSQSHLYKISFVLSFRDESYALSMKTIRATVFLKFYLPDDSLSNVF